MNTIDNDPKLVLDVNEVAALLGVGRTFVYHLINTHRLPVIKLGRLTKIPRWAVEEFVGMSSNRAA